MVKELIEPRKDFAIEEIDKGRDPRALQKVVTSLYLEILSRARDPYETWDVPLELEIPVRSELNKTLNNGVIIELFATKDGPERSNRDAGFGELYTVFNSSEVFWFGYDSQGREKKLKLEVVYLHSIFIKENLSGK